jgi:hypothetical protein
MGIERYAFSRRLCDDLSILCRAGRVAENVETDCREYARLQKRHVRRASSLPLISYMYFGLSELLLKRIIGHGRSI